MGTHLRLDCIGGISGDMFLGALLDACPEHWDGLRDAVAAFGGPLPARRSHSDGVFAGTRFTVPDGKDHPARSYREVRSLIEGCSLPAPVRARAGDMFRRLATCEARVHGVSLDDVHFHELSAWDSIVDIVAAAHLIEALDIVSCAVSALPMGSGRVPSSHGALPLPAPATVLLLDGYRMVDDGREGERVTPTGAVILRHLEASQSSMTGTLTGAVTIGRQGFGFGSRTFEGISNVLRVLLLDAPRPAMGDDRVSQIAFEIDDQSGEELAAALDRLERRDDVIQVLQIPAFGKKGRVTIQVQVLCRTQGTALVAEACLTQTTTIGVRVSEWDRVTLDRRLVSAPVDGAAIGVKLAARPDGAWTAKAEMADLAAHPTLAGRQRNRRIAETAALAGETADE